VWLDGWLGGKCLRVGVTTQQGTTENALISEACSPEAAALYGEKCHRNWGVFQRVFCIFKWTKPTSFL